MDVPATKGILIQHAAERIQEVTEAREVSDHACRNLTGLIEVLGSHVLGRSLAVTSERPEPDRILFRGKTRSRAAG